ncbi:unnamed protein product [Schistosoma curassoni]|uniref:Uncharacterized protein n=1 Tax=Schistosoma curassoni TaxID=6186 RepID=A0A183K4G2_9TREM|nr:unnamed protein product [Schistosoma curassoni]
MLFVLAFHLSSRHLMFYVINPLTHFDYFNFFMRNQISLHILRLFVAA